MAIALRGTPLTASGVQAGGQVVTVPSGVVDGDFMLAAIIGYGSGVAPATPTTPSGWTSIGTASNGSVATNNNVQVGWYYRVASSEPASYTFNSTGGDNWIDAEIVAYSGVNTSPFDKTGLSAVGTGTTTASTVDLGSTLVDGCWHVVKFQGFHALSGTPNLYVTDLNYSGAAAWTLHKLISPAGATGVQSMTAIGGSDGWVAWTLALQPAPVVFAIGAVGGSVSVGTGAVVGGPSFTLSRVGAQYALDVVTGRATNPFSASSRITYLALLTAVPNDATTLASMAETTMVAYNRQPVSWTAPSATDPPETHNSSAIGFGPMTANFQAVTHFALVSAASGTSGDFLAWGPLAAPLTPSAGQSLTSQIAEVSINLALAGSVVQVTYQIAATGLSTSSGSGNVDLSPSGVVMPLGNISGWTQIFTDDFSQDVALGSFPSAVSTKWTAYGPGWQDTSKHGIWDATKTTSQHGSVLDIWLHTESGIHYGCAPVPKLAVGVHDYGADLTAGRYCVRMKTDSIPLYHCAFLLWPESGVWPGDGEIDFPEADFDSTVSAFMHRMNGTSGGDQDAYSTSTTFTGWHTYVIEWRPDLNDCKFFIDDVLIGHSTARVPNTPMHWVLQTETGYGATPLDATQGHVLIDWVVVYVPGP